MLNNACHYSVLSFNIYCHLDDRREEESRKHEPKYYPRELKKGEKEPHTNESSFLSPRVLLKI